MWRKPRPTNGRQPNFPDCQFAFSLVVAGIQALAFTSCESFSHQIFAPAKNKNGVPTTSGHRPCYSPSEVNFF
jgi:hypothetical protein